MMLHSRLWPTILRYIQELRLLSSLCFVAKTWTASGLSQLIFQREIIIHFRGKWFLLSFCFISILISELEDMSNIMRVISLKNYCENTRVVIQLLQYQNKVRNIINQHQINPRSKQINLNLTCEESLISRIFELSVSRHFYSIFLVGIGEEMIKQCA